ncbi:unnamed protein product [Prunus armeniaca]
MSREIDPQYPLWTFQKTISEARYPIGYGFLQVEIVDLHSNQLQGQIPTFLPYNGGSVQAQGGAPAPPVAENSHYRRRSCTSASDLRCTQRAR